MDDKRKNKISVLIFDDYLENVRLINDYFSTNSLIELIPYQVCKENESNNIEKLKIDIIFANIENFASYHLKILEISSQYKNLEIIIYSCSSDNLYVNLSSDNLLSQKLCFSTLQDINETVQQIIARKRNEIIPNNEILNNSKEYIAFQTYLGLRLMNKNKVVYFEYDKDDNSHLSTWKAYLNDLDVIKLKTNTTSNEILKCFRSFNFIQMSQTNILNMNYLSMIELKSRKCILKSPYDNKEIIISRSCLSELKRKYEII